MKLFTASKIKDWENITILKQEITVYNLIDRAATEFVKWFQEKNNHHNVLIVAGPGNNGADAISIASKIQNQYNILLLVSHESALTEIQKKLLLGINHDVVKELNFANLMAGIESSDCIIDGIFGTGLSRPIEEPFSIIIDAINASEKPVYSLDIPSGTNPDGLKFDKCIHARYTFAFQQPKISFFLPESGDYTGDWDFANIHLESDFYTDVKADYLFVDRAFIKKIYQNRSSFSHKGIFGKVLVIAGSRSMPGAMILSSGGALYSGAGKIYASIEYLHSDHLSNHFPEVIQLMREDERDWDASFLNQFDCICVGPGLGTGEMVIELLDAILKNYSGKLVLDADAINVLAMKDEPLKLLHQNMILTPHPGEFKNLFGPFESRLEMIKKGAEITQKTGCTILLKGAYSVILSKDMPPVFNSTGNVSLAQGGSGDVLCGLIGGLCAQGYETVDATILGTYLHGLAADLDEERILSQRGRAYDLLHYLPSAFVYLRSSFDGFGS